MTMGRLHTSLMDDRPIFSIVPIEAWQDKRLRLESLRVLGVLLSFRGKDTNTIWPSRQAIADRCGMPLAKISEATSDLERLGWVKKEGRGGYSKATRYTITVPEIVTDSVTVPQSVTVPEQGTGPRYRIGIKTVTERGTGKELTKNIPSEEKAVAQALPALPAKPKSRKAAITLQAFLDQCITAGEVAIPEDDPIFAYAEKAGITREMLAVAWQEFKAAFLPTDKRQKDWRAHFRNAVRRNWYRLWFLKEGEAAQWTTAGEQARRIAA